MLLMNCLLYGVTTTAMTPKNKYYFPLQGHWSSLSWVQINRRYPLLFQVRMYVLLTNSLIYGVTTTSMTQKTTNTIFHFKSEVVADKTDSAKFELAYFGRCIIFVVGMESFGQERHLNYVQFEIIRYQYQLVELRKLVNLCFGLSLM